MNNDRKSKQALLKRIEVLKEQLIEIGCKKGLNDPDTIKLSQKLDGLMNEYNKLNK